jgi:hypothetical protein
MAIEPCTRSRCPPRSGTARCGSPVPMPDVPDFVERVTGMIIAGQGRPAAGERAAGRRHVPHRHGPVREAVDRHGDPDLGSRDLHRLRPCALVCPHAAIRVKYYDPTELEGAPESFLSRRPEGARLRGQPAHHPGGARRLHRMRRLRQRLPGEEQGRGQAQGHQHGAQGRPPRCGAGQLGLLPRASRRSTGPRSTRCRSRAPRRSSRCSSSAAPARDAARPRTSSWPASCSATG